MSVRISINGICLSYQKYNRTGVYVINLIMVFLFSGFLMSDQKSRVKPAIHVSDNGRYLEFNDGKPFLWLGGTAWGMSEWLTREQVDLYLDNRSTKGFNIVQVCAFWGKRQDDPVRFTTNPSNAYGYKAFEEKNGVPDTGRPLVAEGGTAESPNDYWDHLEYIIKAASRRNMFIALLPVWGRRYVNATHPGFSKKLFSVSQMYSYGEFLGRRLKNYDNIIWVLGGDVPPNRGGDFLEYYRAMAEGIIKGLTGERVKWDETSSLWDYALMTYHPDGTPLKNSSMWFHKDPWLDFNMIETYENRDRVYQAVQQDYALNNPVKPVVMGEPAYEGVKEKYGKVAGIHMRRQAFQSFFGGAAGFTYGAFRDEKGNGPLFSPYKGWEKLLNLEGATTMNLVKMFCLMHNWPDWKPVHDIILPDQGEGELEKVAVYSKNTRKGFLYFPENKSVKLDLSKYQIDPGNILARWYQPVSGKYSKTYHYSFRSSEIIIVPPTGWTDAILIINL